MTRVPTLGRRLGDHLDRLSQWQAEHSSIKQMPEQDYVAARVDLYDAYIASDEWREFSDAMVLAVKNRCEICDQERSRRNLNGHHLSYEDLFNEDWDDVLVVCDACHTMIHSNPLSKHSPLLRSHPDSTRFAAGCWLGISRGWTSAKYLTPVWSRVSMSCPGIGLVEVPSDLPDQSYRRVLYGWCAYRRAVLFSIGRYERIGLAGASEKIFGAVTVERRAEEMAAYLLADFTAAHRQMTLHHKKALGGRELPLGLPSEIFGRAA